MQLIRVPAKLVAILGAAVLAIALAGCDAPSDGGSSDFVGTYKTQDTQGNPMTITLDDNGSASGKRADESLDGSWKEEGGAAVITWGDNWTTKLEKDGDSYKKSTWEGPMEGSPTHTTSAEKT